MTEQMTPDGRGMLSEEAQRRREAMLQELLGDMRRVHRRRLLLSTSASLAALIIVASGATMILPVSPESLLRAEVSPSPAATSPHGAGAAHLSAADIQGIEEAPERLRSGPARILVVRTDPDALDRSRHRPSPVAQIAMIGDEELLDELERINRPAGLVRSDGRVFLTADVTEDSEGPSS